MSDINTINSYINELISIAKSDSEQFKGGQISNYHHAWAELSSDPEILDMVQGYKLEFSSFPEQFVEPHPISFSHSEQAIIDQEVNKLLDKGVIVACSRGSGDFVSNIFLRPKRDGTHRIILNLAPLNRHLKYHHFKMDTLQTVITLMRRYGFLAKIDLKDAYYSVPISPDHQKYLKFKWRQNYYKYTCFAMGLSPCPRKFTKLFKPVCAKLRQLSHDCLGLFR